MGVTGTWRVARPRSPDGQAMQPHWFARLYVGPILAKMVGMRGHVSFAASSQSRRFPIKRPCVEQSRTGAVEREVRIGGPHCITQGPRSIVVRSATRARPTTDIRSRRPRASKYPQTWWAGVARTYLNNYGLILPYIHNDVRQNTEFSCPFSRDSLDFDLGEPPVRVGQRPQRAVLTNERTHQGGAT